MPFTAAHPAIVLPFLRSRYFSATALIIGSMAPDFEYFIKMAPKTYYSHTKAGLFYFDVPMVLILSLVFHLIVKKNLIHNLPLFLQKRFQDVLHFDFLNYLKTRPFIFLFSALAGSASHIFWDHFTHTYGFFVREMPVYQETELSYEGVDYPLYYALQYISSIVGVLLVGLMIFFKKPQVTVYYTRPTFLYWTSFVLIALLIFGLRSNFTYFAIGYSKGIVTVISATLMSVILLGLVNFRNTQYQQLDG
jgi:hypothetical protein